MPINNHRPGIIAGPIQFHSSALTVHCRAESFMDRRIDESMCISAYMPGRIRVLIHRPGIIAGPKQFHRHGMTGYSSESVPSSAVRPINNHRPGSIAGPKQFHRARFDMMARH
ncbi:hypothetical protein Dimus_006148 [Dionaea muscipula]